MGQEGTSIGKGTVIRGDVSGSEALSLEGRLIGRVQLSAALTVEPTGRLEADVLAESVTVHGTASGTIEAQNTITVSSIATVSASLRARAVTIEDGARFSGDIDMDFDVP